ncbi:MAG: hypothetical protein WC860_06770 [Candidatus Margulisiibacteriota bacterium]
MKKIITELRQQFYAETNIEIIVGTNNYCSLQNWEIYAKWLENLNISKFNKETVLENHKLRKAFYKALDILENGLVSKI